MFSDKDISVDSAIGELDQESPTQDFPAGLIDTVFDFRVDSIDERSSLILFARAEIAVLNLELERLVEQVQATRQALRLERSDKKQLAARAEKLGLLFEDIKARKAELEGYAGRMAIEQLLLSLSRQEAKMEKLQDGRDSIEPKVTKEEKKETKESIKKLKGDLKKATRLVTKWLKAIEEARKRLKQDKGRLDAKHRIGDLTRSDYDYTRAKLMRSIGVLSESEKVLFQILANVRAK
ncbi:MAG: hypothetical protein ACW99U_05950 [Candidatus Thorarchaeota archaeon]